MLSKTKEILLRKFLEYKCIEEDDLVIYEYGLDLVVKKIVHIVIIVCIGILCHKFMGVVLFLIFYATLREYSGGYHAYSSIGCYLCTVIVSICALLMLKIFDGFSLNTMCLIEILSGTLIWKLSPQESLSKPFQGSEMKTYRKISHRYLLIEGAVSLLGKIFPILAQSVAVAWIMQGIMLIISYFKSRF